MSIQMMIEQEAIRQGVPVSIALAVAEQESAFNQSAIGSSGEVGTFQLMPATANDLGVNPYDLQQNIAGGISYLKQQYNRFGTWDLAFAAYNAGPGNVSRNNIPDRTRNYVSQIWDRVTNWGAGVIDSSHAMPTFSVNVNAPASSDNFWLKLALGLGIGAAVFMLASPKR